jgi:hypothetical protein
LSIGKLKPRGIGHKAGKVGGRMTGEGRGKMDEKGERLKGESELK